MSDVPAHQLFRPVVSAKVSEVEDVDAPKGSIVGLVASSTLLYTQDQRCVVRVLAGVLEPMEVSDALGLRFDSPVGAWLGHRRRIAERLWWPSVLRHNARTAP
jgi:hypothetical protein